MDALNHGQFDHPLLDTFDLVRISNEDLDVGGRFGAGSRCHQRGDVI